MNRDEFKILRDNIEARFPVVTTAMAKDSKREPGNTQPTMIAVWWEAFCRIELNTALEVVRDMFAGVIDAPFRAMDFPAAICREVRHRRNKANPRREDRAVADVKYEREAAKDLAAFHRLNDSFGREFDRMTKDDKAAIAKLCLPDFWFRRWQMNPQERIPRHTVLEYLEAKDQTVPTRFADKVKTKSSRSELCEVGQ